jgi:hypothetical protein
VIDDGPLALVIRVAAILEDLEIPYALGGSLAASFFGEPRATADIDVAIRVDGALGEALIGRAQAKFYVPLDSARAAITSRDSFNLIADDLAMKVDLFVLGDGLLDRRQIERRVWISLPGTTGLWVTSAEDLVLRKLDWYRTGGSVSDRQWRDVLGILFVRGPALDLAYLDETARQLELSDLLELALRDASLTD